MNLQCVLLTTGRVYSIVLKDNCSMGDNLCVHDSTIPNGIRHWLLLATQAGQLIRDSWLELYRPFLGLTCYSFGPEY